MNVDAVMALAVKHLGSGMESSARVALADAVELRDAYKYEDARNRALRSLQYSVGVFHPDYQRAARGAAKVELRAPDGSVVRAWPR